MKKIVLGEDKKNVVEFYNSAELIPMKRYQRFNKFLMIDNDVGSDFADFNKRSVKAIEYLKKGMKEDAVLELENRRQMVYNAYMEYSPKNRALAILVKSINGEECTDYSSDGLDEIIDKLDKLGFTYKQVQDTVDEVKKKIENELKNYFPKKFNNYDSVEYNVQLIRKLKVELGQIITGVEQKEKLFKAEKNLLNLDKANSWNINNAGNMEREMEVEYTKFVYAVQEHTNEDLNNVTAFRFYALVEYVEQKNKPNGNN